MRYKIQNRIHTLIEHAIFDQAGPHPFTRNDICFSPGHSILEHFGSHKFWIAESEIETCAYEEAWKIFRRNLYKVAPKIAFVGQAYLQANQQPFLVKRTDDNRAFFRYTKDQGAVPLMFMDDELRALDTLIEDNTIPDEFYFYWNDAINTAGYSSKLVLLFAALEALFQVDRRESKAAYYAKIESVFGLELRRELYGTREDNGRSGLRHRLSHGEYFQERDTRDYVEEIHQGIIRHFNAQILAENPLNESVVGPQRHPFGNTEGWGGFVRSISAMPLDLKPLIEAFDANFDNPEGYEIVPYEEHPTSY